MRDSLDAIYLDIYFNKSLKMRAIGSFLASSALVVCSAALLASCASTPGSPDSGHLAERDKALFEQMDLVLVDGAAPSAASCPNGPPPASDSVRDLISKASSCSIRFDWKGAERVAAELARRDLASPWAPYFMSLAAEASGDAPRSLWMIELAQKKAGRDLGLLRYQHGRALLALGQPDLAFVDIQAAVAKEPRLIEGHLFIAETYLRDQDPKRAEESFRRALALEPQNRRGLLGLSAARRAQGDDAEAARLQAQAYGKSVPGVPVGKNAPTTGASASAGKQTASRIPANQGSVK